MPARVVSESHAFGDEYALVPSMEDFEKLEKRLDSHAEILEELNEKTFDLSQEVNRLKKELGRRE